MEKENPDFLKEKYHLHTSPEVGSAARRAEARSRRRDALASQAGEKISQKPADRIQNYLDRFKEIIERENPDQRDRGMDALKRVLYRDNVIKPEEIPDAYWENQRRIIRERGQGADVEYVDWEELKRQQTEAIIADQKSSLDTWIDYLASKDAPYPDWLKYYAMRSVLSMGEYDKERRAFTKRSQGTTKPFPDLNREALAYVLDAIEKKRAGLTTVVGPNIETPEQEVQEFEKLLEGENFGKLYAWAIEKVTPASAEQLQSTQGQWVKYDQGSDHMPLVQSLQGHGTGWCTAGESTAAIQIKGGDFYVYYSHDAQGQPTVPRAAIRMEENRIGEVRGIAEQQNLDPAIAPVVEAKLKGFPDGPSYEKKVRDMKQLTAIEHTIHTGEALTRNDLLFLYEIDSPIEGFGYHKDPRIEELRSQRNPEEDMPIVLECEKDEIARSIDEINKGTKAYVGPLVPGIFDKIQEYDIEHVYTSFPEGRIRKETIQIGGASSQELREQLKKAGIKVSPYAGDMMRSPDFTTQKEPDSIDLIRLNVRDLSIPKKHPTTEEIYKRIEELGLELCPAETGPRLRLAYNNHPIGEWFWIGMKQIADRDGLPRVFDLARDGDDLWLDSYWSDPAFEWLPDDNEFVFRLRKKNLET